jgi:hypothetical protein
VRALARLWHEHRVLTLAFATAAALLAFFLVRTLVFWVYWSDPAHREVTLEGWMTPGYVARAWDVDRSVMLEFFGPPSDDRNRRTLSEIAAARGQSLTELEAEIMAVIQDAKARERTAGE